MTERVHVFKNALYNLFSFNYCLMLVLTQNDIHAHRQMLTFRHLGVSPL